MATPTTNYGFSKPTVGGETDAWGTILNQNWDDLDELLSGGATVDGIVITNGDITATTADLSGDVTIADANITALTLSTAQLTMTGEIIEKTGAITGTTPTIDPADGTIQMWTLTGNSTPTIDLASGETVTLGINDGTGFTITWPAIDWIGTNEPVLETSGINWITLWKVGTTIYGSFAGASA